MKNFEISPNFYTKGMHKLSTNGFYANKPLLGRLRKVFTTHSFNKVPYMFYRPLDEGTFVLNCELKNINIYESG